MDESNYKLIASRSDRISDLPQVPIDGDMAEGGCGVLGVISSAPIKGKYLLQPMIQMHNRGNGKGGGIAAVGLSPNQLGVSRTTLEKDYMVQVAYLDPKSRIEVEAEFIRPYLNVEFSGEVPNIGDHRKIGLEVAPPDVWRYFVRVQEDKLKTFAEKNDLEGLDQDRLEDEFIYRNSFALNNKYYASLGDKRAFVISHGKDMMILKLVGYAEQVLQYYQLEGLEANVWIGHQRYPTKGRVWHPGGSHPFIGLHDALVHNGDFANYHSIVEYLKQRNYYPLFVTDTEVAALYWDLLTRVLRYPLEYAIEAIAPTTERDYAMLPTEKQSVFRAIQKTHVHGSPDGPWFFIIARNDPHRQTFQLIGITDTSMLRPQVFALQEGEAKIGLIASEKQAIDAMLNDLAKDDERVRPMADQYWYARGGSYTDGGAFIFTIDKDKNLTCTDKFGKTISTPSVKRENENAIFSPTKSNTDRPKALSRNSKPIELFNIAAENIANWDLDKVKAFADSVKSLAEKGDEEKSLAIETLTLLIDRKYDIGDKRRSEVIPLLEKSLFDIFGSTYPIELNSENGHCLVSWASRNNLKSPLRSDQTLIIDVHDFRPEGEGGTCSFLERAYKLGWRKIVAYNFNGQRNFGAGLVAKDKVRIDVYGRTGDCLAAFADGPELYVHESAQDSVAYCFKSGKLVIYGDAGKAFEYGAKGGISFILGDLIDRPLINAVGSATAVINGSCKDYMGESCMAANGFSILNGIKFDEKGRIAEQETPYQGGNLFPLAAAGAVYLRDPKKTVGEDQLNGGKIVAMTAEDWRKVLPLLMENERLFGIPVRDLLTIDGVVKDPCEVYRKVVPDQVDALSKYERGA
jgi:glutamate synthase domain-containing protein 1